MNADLVGEPETEDSMSDLFFGGNAPWFSVPALIGTGFFLVRLGLMLVTGVADADGDGFDVDVDIDADADVADLETDDSSSAFKVLSIQTISAFLMGFGWGGLGAYRGWGLPALLSVPVALAAGAAMMWVLAKLLTWIARMQSSGTLSISTALSEEGTVYVTIPAHRAGRGSVRVIVDDRMQYYAAVTDGEALAPQSQVRVVEINEDNTLTVEPLATQLLSGREQ